MPQEEGSGFIPKREACRNKESACYCVDYGVATQKSSVPRNVLLGASAATLSVQAKRGANVVKYSVRPLRRCLNEPAPRASEPSANCLSL